MPNTIISYNEDNKIFDKLETGKINKRSLPIGWVQVYLNSKKVFEGSNLIVAKGREFVAQKMFELSTMEDGTTRPNYYNYKITHFAIGSGGSTVNGNDFTLLGPLISDYHLYNPICLGDEIYLEEPSKLEDATESPIVHSYRNSVKPITTDGKIYIEPVSYEGSPDYYTKVKCVCVIPAGEPTPLSPGGAVQISEAGLYFVQPALADTDIEKLHMFAHICFPPKFKEKESRFEIHWYIIC